MVVANARLIVPEDETVVSVVKGKHIDRLTDLYRRLKLTREQALELDRLVMDIAEYSYQVGHSNAQAPVGEWPDL